MLGNYTQVGEVYLVITDETRSKTSWRIARIRPQTQAVVIKQSSKDECERGKPVEQG
jgi:hypothetical protein